MNTSFVTIPARQEEQPGFEEEYIRLRKTEGRIYSDEEVSGLPLISPGHPHAGEWKMRARSSDRLYRYLEDRNKPLRILEAGCGNGWLANRLAAIPHSFVAGMDVNRYELNQAGRVFHQSSNLGFIYGDIRDDTLFLPQFDVIIFAASIQYFPSLQEVIMAAERHLKSGGEIHLVDTHFYLPSEVEDARKRSAAYYRSMGAGSMEQYYFHHALADLNDFPCTVLYDPRKIINRVRRDSPFYWIRIKPI